MLYCIIARYAAIIEWICMLVLTYLASRYLASAW